MINRIYLGYNTFIVMTQAGFKSALKDIFLPGELDTYEPRGFPRTYPSLVSFSTGYAGYLLPQANCVPIKDLEEGLRKLKERKEE